MAVLAGIGVAVALASSARLSAVAAPDSVRRVPRPVRRAPERTAVSAREARAIERVRKRMPFVTGGSGRVREIALTFDDGPGPYTGEVVATLKRLRVPATFFAVGQMLNFFHGGSSSEVYNLFPVGNHTENHPLMAQLAPVAQRKQITDDSVTLRSYGVPMVPLYRPPYRSFNAETLKVLRSLKLLMVLWSIDSEDYRQPGVAAIVQNATAGARSGSIILMHDGGGRRVQTIQALPSIVRKLRRRGFRLVTVPRLMRDDPPARRQRLPGSGGG
ncbi:MAG: polysaccharide deacetylase family protein [Solirubrobacteraceae bacterium]